MREVYPINDGIFDFANGILIELDSEIPEDYGIPDSNKKYKHTGVELSESELDLLLNGSLEGRKQKKIEELWNACNQEIESGFYSSATGTMLLYGFDSQDRENLIGSLTLMNSIPAMTHIEWKPKGVAPFLHTRSQFMQICQDAFAHKQSKINKYWTLRDQVMNSSDVSSVSW